MPCGARCARQRSTSRCSSSPPPRRADLVQQHDDRLADPAQHLHLERDVAGVVRVLGGVDEVQHGLRAVARRAHRLLAAPEGTVAVAVPHFAQQPAERVVGHAQPLHELRRVAEARRVGQAQHVAFGARQQRVRLGDVGDVRRVAHLADVAAEQRARQRRLAGVGVGDQRDLDGRRLDRHRGPRQDRLGVALELREVRRREVDEGRAHLVRGEEGRPRGAPLVQPSRARRAGRPGGACTALRRRARSGARRSRRAAGRGTPRGSRARAWRRG